MFRKKVKAYLIVFENGGNGLRYLCDFHYRTAWRLHVKDISLIHSDVYDKKCHLCRRK